MTRRLFLLAALLVVPLLLPGHAPAHGEQTGAVAVTALRFEVLNVNRSGVPCATDGLPHTIVGSLVRPADLDLQDIDAATVYLHGSSGGAHVWQLPVSGYDFAAEMARRGHVSVLLDRLGYDGSDRPHGYVTCFGGEADVTRQVLDQLRAGGRYLPERQQGPEIERLALVGHSAGAAVANAVAYSFGGVQALVSMGHATTGESARARELTESIPEQCTTGQVARQADGYFAFPFTPGDFFSAPDGRVVPAWADRLNRDPCGAAGSAAALLAVEQQRLREVMVPVLLLFGAHDVIYEPHAAQDQRGRFSGSRDVTLTRISRAGHAFFLDGQGAASRTHAVLSEWLSARGF